jgi:hypothetical protein
MPCAMPYWAPDILVEVVSGYALHQMTRRHANPTRLTACHSAEIEIREKLTGLDDNGNVPALHISDVKEKML